MHIRMIATSVGDALKYDTTINEIDRAGRALFPFNREDFPNDAITSQRAQLVYDWVLSLGKQKMPSDERERLLVQFCRMITPESARSEIDQILSDAGVAVAATNRESHRALERRDFHREVNLHSRELFLQGNYFHAVFESAKAYNKGVQATADSEKEGRSLMLSVWGCESGVLKITRCESTTDINVQDGVKFLSAGLMSAIRNPTAHEPAIDWPISRADCLDILSFLSFLFRKLDDATYFP